MITVLISRKECNEQCNQWKTWMHTNNTLLKYYKFYTGYRIESIQTTLFITSCQSQSETGSNTWASTVLNFFVNWQNLCVGSKQRNDVTWSILCPNFCKLVTSILDLDLMNLSLKACAWFNPIIQGKNFWLAILQPHLIEMNDSGILMLCTTKCNYEIDMRCPRNHHFPS